jgi:hypothetical protein
VKHHAKLVLEAVDEGKITREEADAYLRATQSTTYDDELRIRTRARTGFALGIAFLLIISVSLFASLSPTGFLVLDQPTDGTTIADAAGVRVSGTLIGEGSADIFLDTASEQLLIASVASDDGTPRTDKPSYTLGESIDVEHAPVSASYYFDDGATSVGVDLPFNATANGTLRIIAQTDEEFITYRLPIVVGEARRTTTFSDVCVETCNATPNGTIRIVTTGDVEVVLQSMDVDGANQPPMLMIPLQRIVIDRELQVDLDLYVADPDSDELLYTVGSSDLVDAAVEGSVLTLRPLQSGDDTLTVYASDLVELVSIAINISVPAAPPAAMENATSNVTNESVSPADVVQDEANATVVLNATLNQTANETIESMLSIIETMQNTTSNETGNVTADTTPSVPGLDCSDPNPNLRPPECLLEEAETYFPEQDIFLQDRERTPVAKVTVIGNLLIRGDVVQQSTAMPSSDVFRIEHSASDGDTAVVAWIDATGDLHLRGVMHEEENALQPPPGSYSIMTKRGIYLAYVDLSTGDLYLRGNLIPYRRSIS